MKINPSILRALAIAGLSVAGASEASAELIFGVNGANSLVTFDSAAPGTILNTVPILGATILNIDFRPATEQLYGLDFNNDLYVINTNTGAVSLVGATGITGGFDYGFDFNPTVDRIRVITDNGGTPNNFRLIPTTGAIVGGDSDLDYTDSLATPSLVGAAYTRNFVGGGTTTLYGIDPLLDILAISSNPNGGLYNSVGALGVDATGLTGFDISSLTGTAFASLSEDGIVSDLYTINLATGAASLIGGIGAGETILDIAAPIPEPGTAIFGLVLAGAAGIRRRTARR